MQEEQENKLLTISDISEYLNIKEKTVYAKVESGEIPHYRIGRLIRFRLEDIDAWLDGCRNRNQPAVGGHKTRGKGRKSSKRSGDHFSKIIRKTIDDETGKYYP
ncbi:MAG TPA: helix-turn-helix domain-containing protein, partial [Smithellaceae bacterium]|nr:helix-turn-helix domain-containing protein [Smithellaceae bacterium]